MTARAPRVCWRAYHRRDGEALKRIMTDVRPGCGGHAVFSVCAAIRNDNRARRAGAGGRLRLVAVLSERWESKALGTDSTAVDPGKQRQRSKQSDAQSHYTYLRRSQNVFICSR